MVVMLSNWLSWCHICIISRFLRQCSVWLRHLLLRQTRFRFSVRCLGLIVGGGNVSVSISSLPSAHDEDNDNGNDDEQRDYADDDNGLEVAFKISE